jgi:hypothetical protein
MHSSTLVCDRNNSARCGLVPKYALVLTDLANFRGVGHPELGRNDVRGSDESLTRQRIDSKIRTSGPAFIIAVWLQIRPAEKLGEA